jgi:hypothetical protein
MRRIAIISAVLVSWSCFAAVEYTADGTVSSTNEAMRWLVNRARFSPEQEADSYSMTNSTSGGTPDYDCCEDIDATNDFGTNAASWATWRASKPPLAPNALMSIAAQKHSQDIAAYGSLSHPSPTATYYPLGSSPNARLLAEGYTNNITGYYENLSYGARGSTGGYPSYGELPPDAHLGLYTDYTSATRGHRQAILNSNAREIGLGYTRSYEHTTYYWTYDWYCNDYGRRTGIHFFTGTIFHDNNADAEYTIGEGIGSVEVRLFDSGTEGAYYDVSTSSGSFAVPIAGFTDGHTISVKLVNKTGSTVSLSIPMGWGTLGEITLTNNEQYTYGTYTQPATDANVGFRETNPSVEASGIQFSAGNSGLVFSTFKGADYAVMVRTNLAAGSWSNLTSFTATGSMHQVVDSNTAPFPSKFYRLELIRN